MATQPQRSFIGIGLALGVAIGSAIGVAMGNIALGIPIGIGVGVAIGAGLDAADKKKRKDRDGDGGTHAASSVFVGDHGGPSKPSHADNDGGGSDAGGD
ncbi:hypothetical protein [Brevundimonas sp. NIBR11]|uniref:hypothetical protein n=1 Tax=Brevundimonas sp. NIBR11 TaxID=3015999 RepID=UPI0022F049FD|nr:hypothetical protein [Brevundimonas sp. NIBR11]WGM30042.1 hypothetical protein KKHFBJBL_00257 [Brevundimonas sp. NIBR11]